MSRAMRTMKSTRPSPSEFQRCRKYWTWVRKPCRLPSAHTLMPTKKNTQGMMRADDDAIRRLRDAITPIYSPVYGDADALDWLGSDDVVIGYQSGGEAYAYPLKVLTSHELVNDVIDGQPV